LYKSIPTQDKKYKREGLIDLFDKIIELLKKQNIHEGLLQKDKAYQQFVALSMDCTNINNTWLTAMTQHVIETFL